MRNLLAAVVCLAILYGVDAFWFNGQYYHDLIRMLSDIYRHFQ